jgi:hypothetical protein
VGGVVGVIVFVGPGLTSFEQLAACAGRLGVETGWIGYPYSRARRWRTRLFVPHVSTAHDRQTLATELRRFGADRIIDIQASEYVLGDVVAAAREAQVAPSVLEALEHRLALSDKLNMSRLLTEHGVPVPAVLDAALVSAQEAVDRLGLPLVVKGRVANGGSSVHIVFSASEAAAALQTVQVHGGGIYEMHLEGESLSYGASFGPEGRLLNEAAYLTRRVGHEEHLPPDRIVVVDDAATLSSGRAVVAALGGSGLVNVNVIKDSDGRACVHDVNLRPWGTLMALRGAGVDFAGDYLAILGLAAASSPEATLAVGEQFDVFPAAALGIAETDLLAALSLLVVQSRQYADWTGVRYVAAESARCLAITARRLLPGRRRSVSQRT